MTPDARIAEIIKDCVAADPSLAGREAELRPIVQALLEAKPDTRFDADVAARLRSHVLAAPSFAKAPEGRPKAAPKPAYSLFETFMKRNPLVVLIPGGAALGVMLAFVLSSQYATAPKEGSVATGTSTASIAMVADGAFGSLMSANGAAGRPQAGGGSGLGMGGDAARSAVPPASEDAKMAIAPGGMPVPDYVAYRYVYKGELPAIEPTLPVYRRIKGFGAGVSLDAFRSLAGGLIDLGKLQSAQVQSFNALEDREFGYAAYIDALEGAISLSQNWTKWPHPENLCRDESCWKQYQLTAAQLPTDEAILGIAERFLADYGIPKDAYGAPEVRRDWQPQILAGADAMSLYVPDSVSVIHPLIVDGARVEDDAGNAQGLVVNVNVRHSRVDGMWGLTSNRYEASRYATETDAKRILSFVERGGLWGWVDPNAKTVDVELGAPELLLTRSWVTRPDGMGEEILVPALRFPVLTPPKDQTWFRKAVVIPVTRETLDAAEQQNGGIIPIASPRADILVK